MSPLTDTDWLSRPSTEVATDLVGCRLVRHLDGITCKGLIVETEAYGPDDPAMHAYQRSTARNQVIFGPAGRAYVYRIYGSYHCLNIVTDQEGIASSVLIRALELEKIPPWVEPKKDSKPHRIAAGPGKLCLALKIDLTLDGTLLQPTEVLWLEKREPHFQQQLEAGSLTLIQTTRIGLTQGADLPRRWYLSNCPSVSKKG
ncbi:MAG: DNA-3-methyladenine glycosylase [Leptolyngbyaceae cyanobacterium SM1_1_3]|nr:DNA-3-methyladenine glycosylase [Leptolyngbyaceae cyanobacterium SM1_1_3]NJN04051.1 DNA-3-methyladenine glycosylase [Leptolyngbyaceae cyanobacterium RM1_1_2]NJO09734.1 DNA-3-methyladenine glycosylase [Leptolyngbyaceae cyanobacterium SL_1_1]